MTWALRIPYFDEGDMVLSAISAAREMEADEQRVVEVLARDAFDRGLVRVGELIHEIEGLSDAQRRGVLDRARESAGLPTTGEVEKRRADFAFNAAFERLQPPAPPSWSPLQHCHHPGCNIFPTRPSGAWEETTMERYWCPAHRHLAPASDLEEHEPAYVGFTSHGRPIPSEREKARLDAWYRERRAKEEREIEKRREHERREAEAIQAVKERYREQGEISVMGVRVRPDMRLVNQ